MISGILALSLAFVATMVSTAAYWLYYRERDERFLNLANGSFVIMGVGIVLSVILLYYNIFAHNFQLNYVYSYTSLRLSTYYLISAFWAGQEGTFLLWLFFGTIYGIILIRSVARKQPLVMFFLMLVQVFLLLIVLKKSPFAMIWHVNANVPPGFVPVDGAGLNPLLENPWMVIHPPVMFLGYSSTAVAFAFALNALVKRDFFGWINEARPWVVFSTLSLGAGIILGGYWSYVTLGWGGYWAWDPVENASFVPWVFSAALLHGLIIQSRQKGLVKTNLFLAGLTFISVLWGSFLTRSGVLQDFSVHSFAESDLNLYLTAFVILFAGIFLYLYFRAFSEMESSKFAEGIFSRETFILLGIMTLLVTGFTVFIGTSSPIYTRFFGQPSNVSVNFYNTISIPIAILMLITLSIAPLLAWKVSQLKNLKILVGSGLAALLMTGTGILLGMTKPVSIVLVFLSAYTVFINGYFLFRILKKAPKKSGAYLAHIGIGLMIVGIITSSVYDKSEKVVLPAGDVVKTKFGFDVKFEKFVKSPDGKDWVKLLVQGPNGSYEADPQFYYSEYTKSYMLSPHVKVSFDKDIYISPISYTPAPRHGGEEVQLFKHKSKKVGDLQLTFHQFIVGDHEAQSPMVVKADLSVAVDRDGEVDEYRVQPAMWMENGQLQSTTVEVPDTDYKIQIEGLDANQGKLTVAVFSPSSDTDKPKDILAVEVSEKPLISVLWLGTILLLLGIAISMFDRMKTRDV